MALALMLLAGSALLIRSFIRLAGVAPGFDANNLLTFTVALRNRNIRKTRLPSISFSNFVRASRIFPASVPPASTVLLRSQAAVLPPQSTSSASPPFRFPTFL